MTSTLCRSSRPLDLTWKILNFYLSKAKISAKKAQIKAETIEKHAELSIERRKDDILYAWGYAETGALGVYLQNKGKQKNRNDPRFKKYNRPVRLLFGEKNKVFDIASGYGFTAFAVKSGHQSKVYGTGINTHSQLGFHECRRDHDLGIILYPVPINVPFKKPKTVVTGLSAGRAHLVIASDKEGVFSLGNNAYGQCGRVIVEDEKYSGSRIVNCIPHVGHETVKLVECGQDHTLFLTQKGSVFACGWGADGQTGLGHYNCQAYPEKVLGEIKDENIVKLSSKGDCTLALNDKGEVFGWGNSEYSQLFEQTDGRQQVNSPVHLKKCQGFGKIVDIAAGGSSCLMLNESGEVFSWGYGILGQGPKATHSWKPQIIPPVLFGRNDFNPGCMVTSISTGLNFFGAITNYGDVYVWGKNKESCLGIGHEKDQFFPMRVCLTVIAKKISLGVDHAIALCKPI